ncbi:hypothetical protein HLB23_30560 [Nocardia uniformis]|uniref:Secreted protein n=1 Tax=Nocardia uniformis TaxID=53432 RepID=A0A849C5Z7_9NOCA|nr:hypothetical protein [Nocardia uniformis]NNH74143.1 hypothetical protein [Nocardia uniformis]
MSHHIIRVLVFVAAIFATAVLTASPARAVTPADCESGGGQVDFQLDPFNTAQATCTCIGGFWGKQKEGDPEMAAYGPHMATVAGAPLAFTCVGLGGQA